MYLKMSLAKCRLLCLGFNGLLSIHCFHTLPDYFIDSTDDTSACEVKTKWPPLCKRHIPINFLNGNCCILIQISLTTHDKRLNVFHGELQYIPRNMHTVFALLCFVVVVIHWLIFPYPSGLLHWHCGNLTIAPVPAKQPWWIWINTSSEFIMNDCITTTK